MLMTIEQYALHRGVSTAQVRRLRSAGRLALHAGRIDQEASDAQLASREDRLALGLATTTEFAQMRGVSTSYVRRLRREGRLQLCGRFIRLKPAKRSASPSAPEQLYLPLPPAGAGAEIPVEHAAEAAR